MDRASTPALETELVIGAAVMGITRTLISYNIQLSRFLDSFLPEHLRTDGNYYFTNQLLPRAFVRGTTIYNLGGGSRPCIDLETKQRLNITLVGLDISAEELDAAPAGVYDRKIVGDLCDFVGDADADAVVCQATLEHVQNTRGAFRGLATSINRDGRVFLFAPSRNAMFARLNRILPQNLKRALLFAIYPNKAEGHDGFKAYYDQCTPSQIEAIARANGLEVCERRLFWMSSYATFFTPAFVLWRLSQLVSYAVLRDDAAESLTYVFRRRNNNASQMTT